MKHAFGLSIPQTVADAVDPETTALIVYDMQVGIIRQMKHGGEVVANVAKVLEVAREVGLRTFFMRHTSLPMQLAALLLGKATEQINADDVRRLVGAPRRTSRT